MPDFYAHQVFGGLVYAALPAPIRSRLVSEEADQAGWLCGLYGPDPLFFHSLRKGDPVCREGHALHGQSPAAPLERCRAALGQVPGVLGYGAGFLCHYVLDAACHPVVEAWARGSSLEHTLLEGAFDRTLTPPGEAGLPVGFPPDSPVCAAAAQCYAQAGPEQFRRSLNRFCALSRLIARARRLTPDSRARRQGTAALRAAMEEAVPRCAGLVGRLVEGLETGQPLDFLPRTDFSGRPLPEPAPA